jgi:hypothetical protein
MYNRDPDAFFFMAPEKNHVVEGLFSVLGECFLFSKKKVHIIMRVLKFRMKIIVASHQMFSCNVGKILIKEHV